VLNGGRYFLAPRVGIHNQEWILDSDPLVRFSVTLTHGDSAVWNVLKGANRICNDRMNLFLGATEEANEAR